MLLPAITRFGLQAAEARYATAARAIGFASGCDGDAVAAERLAEGLVALNRDLDVPDPAAPSASTRREWDARLDLMADQALASGSPGQQPPRAHEGGDRGALRRGVVGQFVSSCSPVFGCSV